MKKYERSQKKKNLHNISMWEVHFIAHVRQIYLQLTIK